MAQSNLNLSARKYAEALAAIKMDEAIINELLALKDSFSASKELNEFLSNPSNAKDAKKDLLKKVFESFSSEVKNLICLLVDRNRINLIPYLAEAYQETFYRKSNIELAQISSIKELAEDELNEIKAQLEKLLNKSIKVTSKIDDSLIAGIKIQVANKVIDSSLKTKLKSMKELLNV